MRPRVSQTEPSRRSNPCTSLVPGVTYKRVTFVSTVAKLSSDRTRLSQIPSGQHNEWRTLLRARHSQPITVPYTIAVKNAIRPFNYANG